MSLKKRIKDEFVVTYWELKDMFIALKCKLLRENYVGRYLYIMTDSERRLLFGERVAGGGYTRKCIIKIFFEKKWMQMESLYSALNHEILHQVLGKHISEEASSCLDNVHKFTYVMILGRIIHVLEWNVGNRRVRLH